MTVLSPAVLGLRRSAARRPGARRTRRMTARMLATLLVLLVTAGCTVGPDFKRPTVPTPAEWRSPDEGPGSLADLGWWQLFEDPVLRDLIGTAVEENRDVQVAVARVAEARAQL